MYNYVLNINYVSEQHHYQAGNSWHTRYTVRVEMARFLN
jgi:hypothetical protein